MRTTITLDPDVAAAVDRLRRESQLGVSAALNALARRGLLQSGSVEQPYVLEPSDLGLRIDVDDVAAALEQLDGPDGR